MFKRIQKFFLNRIQANQLAHKQENEQALKVATAALLVEVAHADFKTLPSEQKMVIEALQFLFKINSVEANQLMVLAEKAVEQSTSLFQFTHLIDRHYPLEEKTKIIEMMWRVAFADHVKDKHEEYVVRQVADLLHVPHGVFTQTRYRAEQGLTDS